MSTSRNIRDIVERELAIESSQKRLVCMGEPERENRRIRKLRNIVIIGCTQNNSAPDSLIQKLRRWGIHGESDDVLNVLFRAPRFMQ